MRVRRLHLTLLACGAAVLALIGAPAQAATAPSPWLQTNADAANSRSNPAETAIGASNVATLRVQHQLTAPATAPDECPGVISTPVFSQSRLYAVVGNALTARDLSTGRTLWSTAVNEPGTTDYSWLAVSHGLVFVGTDTCATEDPFGQIKVYSSATGALVRTLKGLGTTLSGMEIFGNYVVAQYSCPECNGFDHHVVYRVSNGSVVWQTPDDRAQNNVDVGTSVVDGQVLELALTADGSSTELHSYLAYNGAPKWTKPGTYRVLAGDSDAATANNLIVLSSDPATGSSTGALDLNPRSGATRFALPQITASNPALALDAKRIYATCSDDHTQTCAFSTRDGRLLWRNTDPTGGSSQQLSVANGLVYLDTGAVLAAGTGAVVTTLPAHPVLVGSGHVGAYLNGPYLPTRFAIYGLPAAS